MLASVLPGLRELRAPLAAGYLWLAFAWLIFRDDVPARSEATGIVGDVFELAQFAGPAATLAAVTFVAYLVGALSAAFTNYVLTGAGVTMDLSAVLEQTLGWASPRKSAAAPSKDDAGDASGDPPPRGELDRTTITRQAVHLTRHGSWALQEAVINAIIQARSGTADGAAAKEAGPGTRPSPVSSLPAGDDDRDNLLSTALGGLRGEAVGWRSAAQDALALAKAELRDQLRSDPEVKRQMPAVLADLPLMPIRLMGADPELYGAYDRMRTEAEFRGGVSLPLTFVSGPLITMHPAWLFLTVFAVALGVTGFFRSFAAGDTLAEALRAGRVTVPSLDRIKAQERRDPAAALG